jgi:hypothetical protein
MLSREQFLTYLWRHIIDAHTPGHWIDNSIAEAKRYPNAPFADVGPILERLLSLGVTPEELSSLARFASYEAVFGVLCSFGDPGVDIISVEDIESLHESLLGADPSGREGRPAKVI